MKEITDFYDTAFFDIEWPKILKEKETLEDKINRIEKIQHVLIQKIMFILEKCSPSEIMVKVVTNFSEEIVDCYRMPENSQNLELK